MENETFTEEVISKFLSLSEDEKITVCLMMRYIQSGLSLKSEPVSEAR